MQSASKKNKGLNNRDREDDASEAAAEAMGAEEDNLPSIRSRRRIRSQASNTSPPDPQQQQTKYSISRYDTY